MKMNEDGDRKLQKENNDRNMKSAPNPLTYQPSQLIGHQITLTHTHTYMIYVEQNMYIIKTTNHIVSTDCCWKIITVNRVPLIYVYASILDVSITSTLCAEAHRRNGFYTSDDSLWSFCCLFQRLNAKYHMEYVWIWDHYRLFDLGST